MRIVIIGSGNVGWHIATQLASAGATPVQVFSRSTERAHALAGFIHTAFCSNLAEIDTQADFYLLAVPDDAITEVAHAIADKTPSHAVIAHTSGSESSKVLENHREFGVLYPLQTFSVSKPVQWSDIPLLLTGNSDVTLSRLSELARILGGKIQYISDEQRATLHLAATIACNFSNHMYRIAGDLLAKDDLDFELLLPLIKETADKVQKLDPTVAQTGPAVRGDNKTLERHMAQLAGHQQWAILYALISKQIRDS